MSGNDSLLKSDFFHSVRSEDPLTNGSIVTAVALISLLCAPELMFPPFCVAVEQCVMAVTG